MTIFASLLCSFSFEGIAVAQGYVLGMSEDNLFNLSTNVGLQRTTRANSISVKPGTTVNGDLTAIGDLTTDGYAGVIEQRKQNPDEATIVNGEINLSGNEQKPIIVNGSVTAPMLTIRSTPIEGGGTYTYWGYAIINGNVNVDFLSTDNYTRYDDMTDYLEVNGTVNVTRDFYNNGSSKIKKLVVGGTFYNGYGTYTGTEQDKPLELVGAYIGELDAKSIINGSNIFVDSLSNTIAQTYTQTFGTIKVTNNWFTNSTINMSGGILDEAYLGQAHNLGLNNTYNVSGGTLKVGDLRGDSTIHLSANGRLETKIDSVFEDYGNTANPDGLNTINLAAQTPEEIRNTITDIFSVYVPGKVIENVMDRVTLAGGTIVISGFDVTETQRDDLTKAFKEAFFHNCQKAFSKRLTPFLRA